MKKTSILLIALSLTACSQKWNDLVHEEVPAEITAFEVEGQVGSQINKSARTVTVTMPEGTDLGQLTVGKFSYTEGAATTKEFTPGDVVDLSEPYKLTLTTYDEYVWTVYGAIEEKKEEEKPGSNLTKDGPQLYNMGFDLWSKYPDNKNIDMNYGEDATEEQKAVWGSANLTTAMFGLPTVMPEYDFVYAKGEGKAALKLQTQNLAGKLAAGSLFTGKMGQINIWKMSADLEWGIPFTERPAALEGYACYKPQTIDIAQDPYSDRKGQTDIAHVFVLLTDWEKPFIVSPPESLVDVEGDQTIIGYGKVVFDKETDEYERFQVDIEYRSDRTPKYLTIVTSSSALGDYFTGGTGSVLYLDEFALLYPAK